jgi:hypothetical protein
VNARLLCARSAARRTPSGHERVAIAVAADPAAHVQERGKPFACGNPLFRKLVF